MAESCSKRIVHKHVQAPCAHTWQHSPRACVLFRLLRRPAGYVDMVTISDDEVALLFENGDVTFADRVSFQIVKIEQ